jgi:hypothetical protein
MLPIEPGQHSLASSLLTPKVNLKHTDTALAISYQTQQDMLLDYYLAHGTLELPQVCLRNRRDRVIAEVHHAWLGIAFC